MDKATSNFLLGQALSLLLSLSIVSREIIIQTIETQILLEIAFDVCLFSFSLVATRASCPKKGRMVNCLVALAACAALAGDSLFFLSLKFMSNYMCTFFDELNYPISLVVEYLIYRKHIGSFLSVAAYVILLFTTVGLCIICNKEEHHLHLFGVLTGASFNFCYILVALLQTKLTPKMGVFGFTRDCSIYRFAIALLLLAYNTVFGDMGVEKILEFFRENAVSVLLSSIFYAAFYILAAVHIKKFGVPALFANLISSSIYVLLINKLQESGFDVFVFGATFICLGLIYVLVKSGKKRVVEPESHETLGT